MGIYLHFYNRVGAKLTAILWLLTARTGFFVCLNYPRFSLYNQPCIAFIYSLFIFLLPLYGKRAPAIIGRGSFPRSRTGCDIFNCVAAWAMSSGLAPGAHFNLMQPTWAASQVLHSAISPQGDFNLMQSRRLLLYKGEISGLPISILCSHANCFGNSTQRLHLAYNIALCALPFLML